MEIEVLEAGEKGVALVKVKVEVKKNFCVHIAKIPSVYAAHKGISR